MHSTEWAPQRRAVRGSRVLVVDDYRDAAVLLAEALRTRGYESRAAFDGEDALIAAHEFRPEVVFLDIGLPIMDGYEVVRRLRAMPGGADMFMIAVTGYDGATAEQRSREAGFDTHMVKPIDIGVLGALMVFASMKKARAYPSNRVVVPDGTMGM